MTLRTLSNHNGRVVRLGKLSARRRARDAESVFVIDGPTLLAEALDAGVEVDEVFVDTERLDDRLATLLDRADATGAEVFGVGADVLRRVTDPVTPQAVTAVARRVRSAPADVLAAADRVLWLVGVADPGNAGTLVRGAVAAGFDALVVTPGTVEVFGPKALRASAGATFRIVVVEADSVDAAFDGCRAAGLTTVATVPTARSAHDEVDLTGRCAVLIGNEAHGLDGAVLGRVDLQVRIPMVGPVESLNAAMAGTLLCFEILRQRRGAGAVGSSSTMEVPVP